VGRFGDEGGIGTNRRLIKSGKLILQICHLQRFKRRRELGTVYALAVRMAFFYQRHHFPLTPIFFALIFAAELESLHGLTPVPVVSFQSFAPSMSPSFSFGYD
jgi:hypothetical protein